MKKNISIIITVIITITLSVLGFVLGKINISPLQLDTLKVLGIVCTVSVAYCFIVGEITRNNSQMDKLWSVLPIVYAWIVATHSAMNIRVVIMAILITLWGVRLTLNFAKKGAYSIKFWQGEEDYRWVILRKNPHLNKRWKWAIFNLFFISLYQNVLVLAINLPLVAVMDSKSAFNVFDVLVALLLLFFIVLEIVADKQQMNFQTKKYEYLNKGMKLETLPSPYNKGFNTRGLWKISRHPNYFSEQSIWVVLYIFCISAGVTNYIFFNWTLIGSMFLILLFIGSTSFSESLMLQKYPDYKTYIDKVHKYIPIRKK